MKCYICDQNNWHSMGNFHKESEIVICKTCGNVCHKKEPEDEKELIKYYKCELDDKSKYRPPPNYLNIITTNNKTNYIKIFLKEYLEKNKDKQLIIGDVGCATGYLVHFFRMAGHKAVGSEYNIDYRKFCEAYYNIPLSIELPKKYKYDLICLYHVLEHMIEPDKKLKYYGDILNEDGHMLIATPEWFDILVEAAERNIKNWDNLFHKDHINLFSYDSINNLFIKCGFEVIKENRVQYGQTYLIRKLKENEKNKKQFKPESWEKQRKYMIDSAQAIELMLKGKPFEAINIMPRFPEAWVKYIFVNRRKEPDKQEDLFKEMEKYELNNDLRFVIAKANWYYQYQKYDKALEIFLRAFDQKPYSDLAMYIGWCLYQTGGVNNYRTAIKYFMMAHMMNPQKWMESMQWICKTSLLIPTWDEIAMEDMKNKLFDKSKFNPQLIDKFMGDELSKEKSKEGKKPEFKKD